MEKKGEIQVKEFFGKDAREALEKAAAWLGRKPDELKYRLVSELVPNRKQNAAVAVIVETQEEGRRAKIGEPNDEEKKAKEAGGDAWAVAWCKGVLERMGFFPKVELEQNAEAKIIRVDFENGQQPCLSRGSMRGLRGAMQHLLGRLQLGADEPAPRYMIDICGKLEERKEKMRYISGKIKKHLVKHGKWVGIHLMESQDRSLLHLEMKRGGLFSESSGEGKFRVFEVKSGKKDASRQGERKPFGKRRSGKA